MVLPEERFVKPVTGLWEGRTQESWLHHPIHKFRSTSQFQQLDKISSMNESATKENSWVSFVRRSTTLYILRLEDDVKSYLAFATLLVSCCGNSISNYLDVRWQILFGNCACNISQGFPYSLGPAIQISHMKRTTVSADVLCLNQIPILPQRREACEDLRRSPFIMVHLVERDYQKHSNQSP